MLARSFFLTVMIGLWAAAYPEIMPAFLVSLRESPASSLQMLAHLFLSVWILLLTVLYLISGTLFIWWSILVQGYRQWRHDRWFRGEVRASLADGGPGIPHDQAMAEIDTIIEQAERRRDGSH